MTDSTEKFNAKKLIRQLNSMSEGEKNKKAYTDSFIKNEVKKVCKETHIQICRQNREEAIKSALWQGLLNQYGIFGSKKGQYKTSLYTKIYEHGDLVSIDFGTSNIGMEFSYTHTAIVLKSYTDYLVVIPTTSCKEGRLEHKPSDEQKDTLIITDNDFNDIESDSYVMLYQIRSVSKNRIQKIIGSIKGTDLLYNIDKKLVSMFSESIYNEYCNNISLIENQQKIIAEKDNKISELYQILENKKMDIDKTINM